MCVLPTIETPGSPFSGVRLRNLSEVQKVCNGLVLTVSFI